MDKKNKDEKNAKINEKELKTDDKSQKNEEKPEVNEKVKDFAIYEKALKMMEEELAKVSNELEVAKREAADSENLAKVYKKDLERFKERNKTAEQEMKDKAAIATAEKLIPILDNFSRALSAVTDPDILTGFKMIESNLKLVLFNMGIEEIPAVGVKFNPELHNAVAKRKTDDESLDGIIVTEMLKGYKLVGDDGKVVRHSMVEVYIKE